MIEAKKKDLSTICSFVGEVEFGSLAFICFPAYLPEIFIMLQDRFVSVWWFPFQCKLCGNDAHIKMLPGYGEPLTLEKVKWRKGCSHDS